MEPKSKLLVIELWALGDLVLATQFLTAATKTYDVTLLAKPIARELQPHLWPGVQVIPFTFPWTAFTRKYALFAWPWRPLASVIRQLRQSHFDLTVSARWDPRDHFLMALTRAKKRLGFPRLASSLFLTQPLPQPSPEHRYEHWRRLGETLGFNLPSKDQIIFPPRNSRLILIHAGAAQSARIWPLDRFHSMARRLRQENHLVKIACNPDQRQWWLDHAEDVITPGTISELVVLIKTAGLFIGNDSGPGHLAAAMGLPTFTLFGNQFPAAFAPLHPQAEWIEGAPCPYKPCYDSCRFPTPECLYHITEQDAWLKLSSFISRHLPASPDK